MTYESTAYDLVDDPEAFEAEADELGTEIEESDTGPSLFGGDRGELSLTERRTLVILLKRKYLAADKYPREWQTLLDSRPLIEMRLNELFQVLVLDEEREFAFKRSASPEGGGTFPTLLHDRQYTLEETVLLVELRQRYAQEWSSGASVVHVDREELLVWLEMYRRTDVTNRVGTRRREGGAIDGLVDEGILIKIDGDSERFRVAPVINSVLTVEKLRELRQWVVSDVEGGTQA
ncbi:DUF4194 domain-containing protein [Arthrobacter sp. LjRoot78]|uniref:DUF4194 domain-containing protein n=1 Tax=Arthrobacter sp. LjRoot78 TaxID=3342338 RepID=UPI003ECFE27A